MKASENACPPEIERLVILGVTFRRSKKIRFSH